MKKANCSYPTIEAADVAPISSSVDPMNSSRLPIGVSLTVEPKLYLVKATGRLTTDWQAVGLTDSTGEIYFVSPRVFLGLAFQNKKLVRLHDRKLGKKSLIDWISKSPKIKVEKYQDFQVDHYDPDPNATPKQDTKGYPIFTAKASADDTE